MNKKQRPYSKNIWDIPFCLYQLENVTQRKKKKKKRINNLHLDKRFIFICLEFIIWKNMLPSGLEPLTIGS